MSLSHHYIAQIVLDGEIELTGSANPQETRTSGGDDGHGERESTSSLRRARTGRTRRIVLPVELVDLDNVDG